MYPTALYLLQVLLQVIPVRAKYVCRVRVSRNKLRNGINIDIDNPAPTVKVAFGSVWNYHGNNAAPPNDGSARTWIKLAYTLTSPWNVNAVPKWSR